MMTIYLGIGKCKVIKFLQYWDQLVLRTIKLLKSLINDLGMYGHQLVQTVSHDNIDFALNTRNCMSFRMLLSKD